MFCKVSFSNIILKLKFDSCTSSTIAKIWQHYTLLFKYKSEIVFSFSSKTFTITSEQKQIGGLDDTGLSNLE